MTEEVIRDIEETQESDTVLLARSLQTTGIFLLSHILYNQVPRIIKTAVKSDVKTGHI